MPVLHTAAAYREKGQATNTWEEKSPLNQTVSSRMQYILLLLYVFRWNLAVRYYEQKTFWSLRSYMVRNQKGIEILPYKDETFLKYHIEIVQEF